MAEPTREEINEIISHVFEALAHAGDYGQVIIQKDGGRVVNIEARPSILIRHKGKHVTRNQAAGEQPDHNAYHAQKRGAPYTGQASATFSRGDQPGTDQAGLYSPSPEGGNSRAANWHD